MGNGQWAMMNGSAVSIAQMNDLFINLNWQFDENEWLVIYDWGGSAAMMTTFYIMII